MANEEKHSKKQPVCLTLPADLQYARSIRAIAVDFFVIAGFNHTWQEKLKLVIDEIFMNAVMYGSDPDETVEICFKHIPEGVSCEIGDSGTGPEKADAAALKATIQSKAENAAVTNTSGRGLALFTTKWTNEFDVKDNERGGITISFIKHYIPEENKEEEKRPETPPAVGEEKVVSEAELLGLQPAPEETAATPAAPVAPPAPPPEPIRPPAASAEDIAKREVKVLTFSGEVDQKTIDANVQYANDIIQALKQDVQVVFDLTKVKYINSMFIGHLIQWSSKIREHPNCDMEVKGVNNTIHNILETVGLNQLVDVSRHEGPPPTDES